MSNLVPVGMNRNELAMMLEDMATRVREGDSYEGNIEYTMPIDDGNLPSVWPSADHEFWVSGVYRIGNLQGQGGVRMIGSPAPSPRHREGD